ncbi:MULTISPECIES: FMN-binding negative transcriptional regulator [Chromobacterium]|uniref:FMN-binding negative transcriptional regulator n=1 Tax=Chromobacterium TaxID=535 RepID=UPI00188877CD|nr:MULTISPECIES: FMN-binding negative transcriptional regulator [Chromobacterium]WON82253.1 FMN-binding negative transcriptional regulator [Chromobacterium haemolyticum]
MMYTPDAFSGRPAALAELLAAHPFATLITPQTDGEPWISHLILLADPEQPDCLLGHLARANPHTQALLRGSSSVALFHGEHGYVSPAWCAAGGAQVPTWNYRAAHAHGVAEEMEGAALLSQLERQVRFFEGESGWRLPSENPAIQAMQRAVVGFRLRVKRWDIKEKLSQNRSAADRNGVSAALERMGGENDALARAMRDARRD